MGIRAILMSTIPVAVLFACTVEAAPIAITSPNGQVVASVCADSEGRLTYSVRLGGQPVIEPSPLGVVVDGEDLGQGVAVGAVRRSSGNETYPWLGVHSTARNHYRGATIAVTHTATGTRYTLEVRAFDCGMAMRYIIAGDGQRTVSGEVTAFTVPAGSTVWFQTNTNNYEKPYLRHALADIKKDTYLGPPLVVRLPDQVGYAAVSEAALSKYSGMTLKACGEGSPVFEAAFQDDKSWILVGTITTPWRVVMVGPDLNTLVNSDIIWNLCPPAPKELANADWIRPGRSLWHWWSGTMGNWDSVAFDKQKAWIDATAEFGFEYYLVDAGWEHTWVTPDKDKWAHLKELCDYGKTMSVGVNVWKRWTTGNTEGITTEGLDTPELRRDFFKHCSEAGVTGIKIDYMDSESVKIVQFYEDVLVDAAKYRLMVNFHGAYKPTGEPRTWPNEVSREGIQGLEYNKWSALAPSHYASLPFTRYLVGHGDFTPGTFTPSMLKGTTFALQLASAVCFTSPVMHWADKPEVYRECGAFDVIKAIPSVWDETCVLPGSQIGDFAAMVRRSGDVWFVGLMNGLSDVSRGYTLELSFLPKGQYEAELLADVPGRADAFDRSERTVTRDDTITVKINPGGGFVAVLTPVKQ